MAHLGNTIVNGALRVLGGENVDTINGVTVGASPKFTDTDTKVTQTATTANAAYEVLFSETADNTTRTEGSKKAATLRFNPASAALMQGTATVASGFNSHAEGYQTTASGNQSHAEGHQTIASGDYSHAEGIATQTIGDSSHAEGYCTTASGDAAHAEGHKTTASGTGAHAEGGYTTATTGGGTKATGENSHAEGYGTTASGQSSHAEGYNTLVVKELYSSMYGSHAEGYQTTCGRDGSGKHAEGFKTSAYGTGAHSEGIGTVAKGDGGCHAEGWYTTASGLESHAEGSKTIAQGASSHAEGDSTTASGSNSHAEGHQTIASGDYSHASGTGTCATGANQTVIGQYNVADTSSAFIIGNGNSSTRSNALKIDFSGNFYTNRLMVVSKESSRSTSTVGTWTAMCRSDQAGSPTLPTTSEWWNVISLNNWTDTSNNWVSQLAIATQDSQGRGVWWRTNNSGGTDISSSTWHRLADGENNGLPKFYIKMVGVTDTAWDELIDFSKLKSSYPYYYFYAGSSLNFLIINPCEKTITISLYLNNNDSRLADSEKGFAKDRLTIFELQNTGIFKYFSFNKPYLLYAMFTGNQSVANSSYTTAMEVPYFYSNFNGYGVTADFQNGVYGSSAIINNRVNVINCYAKFQFI